MSSSLPRATFDYQREVSDREALEILRKVYTLAYPLSEVAKNRAVRAEANRLINHAVSAITRLEHGNSNH